MKTKSVGTFYPQHRKTLTVLFHLFQCFLKPSQFKKYLTHSNWDTLLGVQVHLRSMFLLHSIAWTEIVGVPNECVSCQIWLAYPFELFANDCSTSEG